MPDDGAVELSGRLVQPGDIIEPSGRLIGITEPRLWTPPLRPLTRETSLGYDMADFADQVLGKPFLPWQRWAAIHAMELLPDCSPRFRTVIIMVARQNGKSDLSRTVSMFKMFVLGVRLVVGTAQDLDIAIEMLDMLDETIEDVPDLKAEKLRRSRTNGNQYVKLTTGPRYKVVATTPSAGRSLTVNHLNLDELREHRDWKAWGSLTATTSAVPDGQTWGFSNAGDDGSVVVNQLRSAAGVEDGADGVAVMGEATDPSIFWAEWSAPEGCELDDEDGIRQANPGLGYTVSLAAITSARHHEPPEIYRTERLCQHVKQLQGAVNLGAWASCSDATGSLAGLRDGLVVCFDVSPDGKHCTLIGAAEMPDARIRVGVLGAWRDIEQGVKAAGEILKATTPRGVVLYPSGPVASVRTDIAAIVDGLDDTELVELKGTEVTESCMAFARLVEGRRIVHPSDKLIDAHLGGATKLFQGDGWRFVRRGAGHVDAAYALAGAVHGLRTMPEPEPVLEPIIVVGRSRA